MWEEGTSIENVPPYDLAAGKHMNSHSEHSSGQAGSSVQWSDVWMVRDKIMF